MSKIIQNDPRILRESLLGMNEACEYLPIRCSRSTLERFIRMDSKGTALATAVIGGRRVTSKQAIDRWLNEQQQYNSRDKNK